MDSSDQEETAAEEITTWLTASPHRASSWGDLCSTLPTPILVGDSSDQEETAAEEITTWLTASPHRASSVSSRSSAPGSTVTLADAVLAQGITSVFHTVGRGSANIQTTAPTHHRGSAQPREHTDRPNVTVPQPFGSGTSLSLGKLIVRRLDQETRLAPSMIACLPSLLPMLPSHRPVREQLPVGPRWRPSVWRNLRWTCTNPWKAWLSLSGTPMCYTLWDDRLKSTANLSHPAT